MGSKPLAIKARNRHAVNPIMKKGGCHRKPRKAQRLAEKQVLRSQLVRPAAERQVPWSMSSAQSVAASPCSSLSTR